MKKYDYLIVGAGPFGCVCAQEITKTGRSVLVIDKRSHVAGNAYTKRVEDIDCHIYGAHIFHTKRKEIWEYVNSFGEFLPFVNSPLAYYKGEMYNLPFNMNTFYALFKTETPQKAMKTLEKECGEFNNGEPKNLEEQAKKLVGKTIYEKLIKGYTEKQWGRACRDLPPFIIRRIPLRFTYDNNYFTDPYQGIPVDGYTSVFANMLKCAQVQLKTDFFSAEGQALKNQAKKIIYTGEIDKYFGYCYGALEYRSLRFETEVLPLSNYQGNAVVNYTDGEIPYTRVIEHKHFTPQKRTEKTVVTWEYPAPYQKGAEAYYPVNDEKNDALYKRYSALAEQEKGVLFGGRLAEFRYMDMDGTVYSALELMKREGIRR